MELREKVIKALELCTSDIETRTQVPCEVCPYHNNVYYGVLGGGCCEMRSLQRDMLALLKAQESVESTDPDDDMEIYCGYCGETVGFDALGPSGINVTRFNYCPNCGRAVKWDD